VTRKTREAKCPPGTLSQSDTHLMFEDGTWHKKQDINWRDPARITLLDLYLSKAMSAGEIARTFGDVSRSGVIGAISRLNKSGHLGRKLEVTTRDKKDRKQLPTRQKLVERVKNIQRTVHKVQQLDHQGHQQTVEIVEWKEQPALAEYNLTRITHAKTLLECTGCKWVVDDKNQLMCNDKPWKTHASYCMTHARWAQPTALDTSKRQITPNKGYASFMSPWDTRNKR
jgi:hypothetical protein